MRRASRPSCYDGRPMRRCLLLGLALVVAGCSRNVIPDDASPAPSAIPPRASPAATPSAPAPTPTEPVRAAPTTSMPPAAPSTPAERPPSSGEFALVPAHRPRPIGAGAAGPGPGAGAGTPAAGDAQFVSGTVEIAPELASKVAPGDVVWIVARPAEGGRPVGIVRIGSKLPQPFRITPADNPMGSGPFPPKLLIKARVDKDGDAMSTSDGDLEGLVEDVAPGSSDVRILVDQEIAYE